MQLKYRNRLLSRGDSEPYLHWQVNIDAVLSFPSAVTFQATSLPEMSMHRKEVHQSHVLQTKCDILMLLSKC